MTQPAVMGDEALRSAAGLDSAAPTAFAPADLLKPPVFRTTFFSAVSPDLCGPVAIRYPTMSDLLDIERVGLSLGGGAVAEWTATLRRCLEEAPHGWWKVSKDQPKPYLNPDFQDGDALQDLFQEFLAWRRSVRGGGRGSHRPGELDAPPAVGREPVPGTEPAGE